MKYILNLDLGYLLNSSSQNNLTFLREDSVVSNMIDVVSGVFDGVFDNFKFVNPRDFSSLLNSLPSFTPFYERINYNNKYAFDTTKFGLLKDSLPSNVSLQQYVSKETAQFVLWLLQFYYKNQDFYNNKSYLEFN